ncbi:MAG TPA: amidase [Actinomycetes bacterium]|nr:amidase [Actinomycetes bacterium]
MATASPVSAGDDDLCFRPATELAAMVRAKEVSARELVAAHLDRVERFDGGLRAFITVTPERAMVRAAAADEALAGGDVWGPLHGLPVAHKDLQLTRDVRTTFGSPIFADFVPEVDSSVVQRMTAAGAVSLGKTNTPEFGTGSQTYNPLTGPARNPYDPSCTPGGSSGGAAAALASGMVCLADGSDMGGSLRNPASFCNVVGLRPCAGRVPSWPAEIDAFPLAVAGPMARTVGDCALLLSVLAGADPRVLESLPGDGSEFAGSLASDRAWRVGWCSAPGGLPFDPDVTSVLESSGRPALLEAGFAVSDVHPDLSGAEEAFRTWRAWYYAGVLGPLLDEHPDQVNADIRWNIEEGRRLTTADLVRASRLRASVFTSVASVFEDVDVIALPVSQVPPFPATQPWPTEVAGQPMHTYLDWMRSAYWISATGLPAMSVPCGFTAAGLPVGIQLVGRPLGELDLLRAALRFESATQTWRRRPTLAASSRSDTGAGAP